MRETLSFITGNFNNIGNPYLNKNLVETSYSIYLTFILIKREARFRSPDAPTYSFDFIFLPQQIKSLDQWKTLVDLVSEEKLLEVYQPRSVLINQLLYDDFCINRNSKTNIIFLERIAASFGNERVKLLEYLSIIIFKFDSKKLLNNMHYWRETFYKVSAENRLTFLIFFGYENYKELFPEHHNLQSIADNLTPDEFYYLSVYWDSLIRTYISYHFEKDLFGNHIITRILTNLPEDKRLEILKDHSDTSYMRPVGYKNLPSILRVLPTSQRYALAVLACSYHYIDTAPILRYPSNPIPLMAILEQIPEDQRLDYLKTLGSDFIINLIVTETISWSDLESVVPQTMIDHLQNEFVQRFTSIYASLRVGQSSFFKSDTVAKLDILKINPVVAIHRILDHARLHPDSRSEQALAIMKKFSCFNTFNSDLIKKIYIYGYTKSGVFKCSNQIGYFEKFAKRFKKLTRGERLQERLTFFDPDVIELNLNSRRGKIYKSLN
jgi:hypothetical protein